MGRLPFIKTPIVFDEDARFGHRKEQLSIETLLAEAAMKTLNTSILPGAT